MTEHCCSLVSIFDATGTKSLVHNLSDSSFVCPSISPSSSSSMQLKKAVAGSKETERQRETVIECLSMVSIIIMTYLNILLTSDTL